MNSRGHRQEEEKRMEKVIALKVNGVVVAELRGKSELFDKLALEALVSRTKIKPRPLTGGSKSRRSSTSRVVESLKKRTTSTTEQIAKDLGIKKTTAEVYMVRAVRSGVARRIKTGVFEAA